MSKPTFIKKYWLDLAALCLLTLPLTVHAQFTYTTNGGTITLTRYNGSGLDVAIPNFVNIIGSNAFYRSGVTNVAIPNSVRIIDSLAFDYSHLLTLGIAKNVTNVGDWAFADCPGLTSVTVPNTLLHLGDNVFANCLGLTNIFVSAINPNYASTNGVLFNKTLTTLMQYPAGLAGSYGVPTSVTNISDYAFYGCYGLPSVTIPSSVIGIGTNPFRDCFGLTNIAVDASNPNYTSTNGVLFNKTLTTLMQYPGGVAGSYAIPNSVINIGDWSFTDCSNLTSVAIPNSLTRVGYSAFYGCFGMTNVTIGNSVAYIDGQAFEGCSSLTSVSLPNSVTNMGWNVFASCSSLKSVAIPTSLTSIPVAAFALCYSLTNVIIPNSVTSIGTSAFIFCGSLKSVAIPNSVTSIGDYAFDVCSNLTSVTIGNGVTNIGAYAFSDCEGLTQAYFQGNAPSVNELAGSADSTVFAQNYGSGTVYYLPGTTGWGATFGGWPTALWNPQIQTANSSFDVGTNQFGFNLSGTTNIPVVVEASTNLNGVWTPLLTGTLTNGSIYFADPQWTNYPKRFYRVRSP